MLWACVRLLRYERVYSSDFECVCVYEFDSFYNLSISFTFMSSSVIDDANSVYISQIPK